MHNFGLCVVYALVGFVPSFISTPLSVYLVKALNAHPIIQNQVGICISLPWAFKIGFGFISDALPLCGERRRPYILLGTLVWGGTLLFLGYVGTPSSPTLGWALCIATAGMVLADTICDAMIVERSTKECEDDHGHLQSFVYAVRFGAAVLGAILGGLVYNQHWVWSLTFAQILASAGTLPLVVLLPALLFVKEMENPSQAALHPPVAQQLQQIWGTVTLPIVYMPMLFIFLYNLLQVPNVAWGSYLQLTLNFTPAMLGALSFGGRLMTFVGILIYKKYFLRSSWRAVYVFSTCLLALLSVLQLLLIFQINQQLGISNFLFSLGDDVVSALILGLQFLPLCLVYMKLCPGGSEGATCTYLSQPTYPPNPQSTQPPTHPLPNQPTHPTANQASHPPTPQSTHLTHPPPHCRLTPDHFWEFGLDYGQFPGLPSQPHLGRVERRHAARRPPRTLEVDRVDLVPLPLALDAPLASPFGPAGREGNEGPGGGEQGGWRAFSCDTFPQPGLDHWPRRLCVAGRESEPALKCTIIPCVFRTKVKGALVFLCPAGVV